MNGGKGQGKRDVEYFLSSFGIHVHTKKKNSVTDDVKILFLKKSKQSITS